jgi:hypothetical protein
MIQDILDFPQCEVETRSGVSVTERAIHIAGAVHLDDAHTGVLLVIRTQPAIIRTTMNHFRGVLERDGTWFIVLGLLDICLGIAVDQRLEVAMFRATFVHVDLVVS